MISYDLAGKTALVTGDASGIGLSTVAMLGRNGAGKTTTLEMMETLRSIDSGSVTIDGIDVAKNPDKIKRLIGVQPQTPAFQDKTRLTEVIEMFAAAYGVKVDPLQFLRDVDLEEKAKSYVETLSGGQKQRLSITTALVHGPKVFFLDEPAGATSPVGINRTSSRPRYQRYHDHSLHG